MNHTQTAKLLTLASTIDHVQRTTDDVNVWALVLADVDNDEAVRALVAHFADPDAGREFLKPAHITGQIRSAAPSVPLPPRAGDGECDLHPGYPVAGGCTQCARHPEDRAVFEATGRRPELVDVATSDLAAGRLLPGQGFAY